MFPSATNPSSPPDSRWASMAFANLSEGLGAVYDPALGAPHVSDMLKKSSSLSESIAEQLEEDHERETHLTAQDSHEIDGDDAQIRRSQSGTDVPDGTPGQGSTNSGSLSRDANSTIRSSKTTTGPSADKGTSLRPNAVVETISRSNRPTSVEGKSIQASQPVSPAAVRGVPAAVLRAIEVEANIEAGSRNITTNRGPQAVKGSGGSAVKSMGEAEIRTLKGMTALMAQRGGRMRVQLNPLQLGSVMIDVKVDGGRVEASIEAATKSAVRVLEASTSRLKLSLESQGYTLDRIEIKHEPQSSSTTEDSQSDRESPQSQAEQSDSDGQSRWDRMSKRHRASHASNEEFNLSEQIGQEINP